MANEKGSEVPNAVVRSGGDRIGETAQPLLADSDPRPLTSVAPKDRYLGVFFIIFLHGCAVLAPWNMFITYCYPYFVDYKLSNEYANKTGNWNNPEANEWQQTFCHRMTVANQVPNMLFTLINCFVQFGDGTLGVRIVVSLLVVVASFVVTVLLAVIDTSESAYAFIIVSLIVVVVMMAGAGVYQNCVWGLIAPLPMQYANAIVLGNNFIGIVITVFSIATMVTSPDMKIAAIYYFMMGIFLLLAAFDTYFALPLLKFYRYHLELKERNENQGTGGVKPSFADTLRSFGAIFKKLWVHYWDVFFTFYVTLFAFPNVVMWIKAGEHENFFLEPLLYPQVLCFLTFNVFAFLGNLIPNWFQYPKPRHLWIFTTARFFFIPFFLLLNYQPPNGVRRFDVLIPNSWVYWIAMMIFSLTHGHGSSLAMMYAPKQAEPRHAGKAAMLAGVFLVLGVNMGIITSGIVDKIMLQ